MDRLTGTLAGTYTTACNDKENIRSERQQAATPAVCTNGIKQSQQREQPATLERNSLHASETEVQRDSAAEQGWLHQCH